MRICKSICVMFLLSVFLVSPAKGFPQDDNWDKDNYGKLIGQIVDAETGEPVKESFRLIFYDSRNEDITSNRLQVEDTDKNGFFEFELIPYTYFIQLYPLEEDSIYCKSPYPFFVDVHKRISISIKKGKISSFRYLARSGGSLKIITTDIQGSRINPVEAFDVPFDIIFDIQNPIFFGVMYIGDDDLTDGNLNIHNLYPGEYSAKIIFKGLGYRDVSFEKILIEYRKTTEIVLRIDLEDQTGIEGIVTDSTGVALENVRITFYSIEDSSDERFYAFTKQNGYYKLNGMPPGVYGYLYSYFSGSKSTGRFSGDGQTIKIEKGVLGKLDIKFKYTKNELEGLRNEN